MPRFSHPRWAAPVLPSTPERAPTLLVERDPQPAKPQGVPRGQRPQEPTAPRPRRCPGRAASSAGHKPPSSSLGSPHRGARVVGSLLALSSRSCKKENKPRRQLPLCSWLWPTLLQKGISPYPPPQLHPCHSGFALLSEGKDKDPAERRRSPPPARTHPGHGEKPFASCCWEGLAPHRHPIPCPMPRGRPHTSPPAGFRAFPTPRQTPEGPRPHLRSPVPLTQAEESKASPAPALLNRRLSFLSGSATLQRPQSHSKSQFPAGTWRWAHSGELHQAAGIKGGEAWLKPKPRSALPSRGRECGSEAGGNRWDEGCRRRAGHHPNTQLFVVALPKLHPCALGAGLGDAGGGRKGSPASLHGAG